MLDWCKRLSSLFTRAAGCERGVSAVEFSLLSPVLVLGAFATVDAGMAVYDKMMISQVLRAGAHSAIAAETESSVLTILRDTAADNFTVATGAPAAGELSLAVNSYCACPDALTTAVACTATCTGAVPPSQFYDISASMEFDGVLLPNFTLDGEMVVLAQ
jgi:pilus assembly protein CpaE